MAEKTKYRRTETAAHRVQRHYSQCLQIVPSYSRECPLYRCRHGATVGHPEGPPWEPRYLIRKGSVDRFTPYGRTANALSIEMGHRTGALLKRRLNLRGAAADVMIQATLPD